MANNNNKVKGLLKGLRFISQIFDNNEKEAEIQIGHPTDVKHVAHIGWDGPTESAPSWMNEYKSVSGISPAPQNPKGHSHSRGLDNSMQHSEGNIRECQAKEKSDRPRHHKKSSKHAHSNDSCNGSKPTEQAMHMDMDSVQLQRGELPPRSQPDIPKSSHPKMSKDSSNGSSGGSSKSRSKAQHRDPNNSNQLSPRSSSKSRNKHRSFDEDGQLSPSRSSSKSRNKHRSFEEDGQLSPSRSSSKSRNKHMSFEEHGDGQLERGSRENLLRNYQN